MILSLIQPIIYQEPAFTYQGSAQAYERAIAHLDGQDVGSEVLIALTSTGKTLFVRSKSAPSASELEAIAGAEAQPSSLGPYVLEAGRYEFFQLALPPSIASIMALAPIAIDGPPRIYVRLLKEGVLTIVAQIWISR